MMNYKDYLVDDSEQIDFEIKKELAQKIGDNISCFSVEKSKVELSDMVRQCDIVESAFVATCHLLQDDSIMMNTCGDYFYFSIVHSENENSTLESVSPDLSRKKLMPLKIHELARVVASIILDKDNWSKDKGISYKLADGNGNWI